MEISTFEFWMSVYAFGSLVTLLAGTKVNDQLGGEFSNMTIWLTSAIWFIVIPPAFFLSVMSDDEDEE